MLKHINKILIAALSAIVLFISFGMVQNTAAYLTDTPDPLVNPFTFALDPDCEIVEDFRPEEISRETPVIQYMKSVQVHNNGTVTEYVRVKLTFSDSQIENNTQISWNGTNFYSVSDYKNHLPNGWIYNDADGYYYYNTILEPENKSVTNMSEIEVPESVTPPLITYVRTDFGTKPNMKAYNILVTAECIASYLGNDYQSAWAASANP